MNYLKQVFLALLILFGLSLSSCVEDFIPQDCNEWCAEVSPIDGIFDTNGDCMSLCQTCNNPSASEATTANCICNWFEEIAESGGVSFEQLTGVKNHGQCVKAIIAGSN